MNPTTKLQFQVDSLQGFVMILNDRIDNITAEGWSDPLVYDVLIKDTLDILGELIDGKVIAEVAVRLRKV